MRLVGEAVATVPTVPVCEQATEHQEQRKHDQRQERAVHVLHLCGTAEHQRQESLWTTALKTGIGRTVLPGLGRVCRSERGDVSSREIRSRSACAVMRCS